MIYCPSPDCKNPQNPDDHKYCQNCGSILHLQERFHLIKLIARGGFSRTFLAVDESQSPSFFCAIKQFCPVTSDRQILDKAIALFHQESLQLELLGKHPQIPTLIAHFTQEQYFYSVREYIDGMNLAKVIEAEGIFNEAQIWQVLESLLPVLKFIHAQQIIHRDIKPANIIRQLVIDPKGEQKSNLILVDFAAAKLGTEINQLQTVTSIGSAEYVAPEQAKGQAVFASDLYSLGVTCIYLLTGISPFDLFDVVNDTWVWRDYLINKPSDRLSQILDKLLQNSLSLRFKSADEVIQAIKKAGVKFNYTEDISPSVNIINPCPWQCFATLGEPESLLAHVNSVAIHPEGNMIASGSDDKTVRLWDLTSGKVIYILTGHSHFVKTVAWNFDGTILASGSDDKTIKLWKLNQEICTLSGHLQGVKSVAFSPDGKILASSSWDKTIKLWEVSTGKEIVAIAGHLLQVTSVAFSPCGNFLASASFDRTVRLWDISSCLNNEFCPQLCYIFSGHLWPVLTVAFSPDGKFLATGSNDKTIKLWDLNSKRSLFTFLGHSWSVVAVAFTPNGETLVSGSWDKTIKLWQIKTGQEITTLCGHSDSVSAVCISSNGEVIASGSKDQTIKLWHLTSGFSC